MVAEYLIPAGEQFRALVENNNDIIAVLDAHHKLRYRSPSACRITGYTNEEIDSMRNIENMHPEDQATVMEAIGKATANPGKPVSLRYRSRHKQGHWLDMEGTLTNLLEDPAVQGIVFNFRDITEKIIQQQQLQETIQGMQQKMKQALLRAQERERHAIGAELHDNVNQLLAGTRLLLSMLKTNPEKIGEVLPACLAQVSLAIEANRRIAHEFASPELMNTSLVLQLERLLSTMLEPAGITGAMEAKDFCEQGLTCEQKVNLYRIAQEQCSNIVKHAAAKSATITLQNRSGTVVLSIKDDGSGMTCQKKIMGIGLNNIRGRLDIFNGCLDIQTAPGQGFALHITMPVGVVA